MNKSKVRGLKWNLKKVRGSILHFSLIIIIIKTVIVNAIEGAGYYCDSGSQNFEFWRIDFRV